MAWFAPFLLVGGVAAATAGAVWHKRREAKRLAVWRQLAAEMGATFVEPGGFWRPHPATIVANVGVARIMVDTKTEQHGDSSTTYTRGRVGFPLGVAPHFRIFKDGVLSTIGSKLGMRDVELGGHPEFDDWFAVRSPGSADWLNRVWTDEAKDMAVRLFPKDSDEKLTLSFADIARLEFSGKDTAAGKSFEKWMERYRTKLRDRVLEEGLSSVPRPEVRGIADGPVMIGKQPAARAALKPQAGRLCHRMCHRAAGRAGCYRAAVRRRWRARAMSGK